jgi:hypothetical protein
MTTDQKIVLGAGAFGGLVSWAYTILAGTTTFQVSYALAVVLCVILGIAAAFIAVYLLTPTDTSQTRKLMAYAILCGFMWKPVLDGGSLLIKQRKGVADLTDQVPQQASNLTTASPAQVPQKRTETEVSAAKLLRESSSLGNPDVKESATKPVTAAVDAIAATSTQNPAAAQQSLEHIAQTARETDNLAVLEYTQKKLRLIPRSRQMLAPLVQPVH